MGALWEQAHWKAWAQPSLAWRPRPGRLQGRAALEEPQGLIAFEDFEASEAGQSHEFVSPALLTPSPVPTPRRPNWVPCRCRGPRKDRFELRRGRRVHARRVVGGVCYVSTAEAFVSSTRLPLPRPFADAQAAARAAPKNVVAVVAPREGRNKAPVFELVLVSAQRGRAARPLCEVRPSSVWCDRQGAELRRLAIALPESAPTAHYTHDWNSQPVRARRPPSAFSLQPRAPVGAGGRRDPRADGGHARRAPLEAARLEPAARLPVAPLRPEARARVVVGSSRLHGERARDPKRRDDAEAAVFQLGKLAPSTFALDFRRPPCPRCRRRRRARGLPRAHRAACRASRAPRLVRGNSICFWS